MEIIGTCVIILHERNSGGARNPQGGAGDERERERGVAHLCMCMCMCICICNARVCGDGELSMHLEDADGRAEDGVADDEDTRPGGQALGEVCACVVGDGGGWTVGRSVGWCVRGVLLTHALL